MSGTIEVWVHHEGQPHWFVCGDAIQVVYYTSASFLHIGNLENG